VYFGITVLRDIAGFFGDFCLDWELLNYSEFCFKWDLLN
jgi:hypothetical protein